MKNGTPTLITESYEQQPNEKKKSYWPNFY